MYQEFKNFGSFLTTFELNIIFLVDCGIKYNRLEPETSISLSILMIDKVEGFQFDHFAARSPPDWADPIKLVFFANEEFLRFSLLS